MDPQILIPAGKPDEGAILRERNQEVKMRSAPKTPDSFFDSLRPRLPDNVRPFYEDRVLVRRIDKPDGSLPSELLASPEVSERERTGPQMGIVVAVGSGATGYGMLPAPGSEGPDTTPRRHRWKQFRVKNIDGPVAQKCTACGRSSNFIWASRIDRKLCDECEWERQGKPPVRRAFQVKPGDTVWYERVPPNEFVRDGELYTFLYEDQSILGVCE